MFPDKSIKSPEAFVRFELTSVFRYSTSVSNEVTVSGRDVVKEDSG